MRIIKRLRVEQWKAQYPDAAKALTAWYLVARRAEWRNLQDVRRSFPHADGVAVASGRVVTIFNIRRNRYRLITAIHYNRQRLFVMRLLTHAEYDKERWKDQL